MLFETETYVQEKNKTKQNTAWLIEKQFLKKQDMKKSFSNDSKYSGWVSSSLRARISRISSHLGNRMILLG